MTAPIHKTCYRCPKVVPEFVDPTDPLGGQHGVCIDCRLVTAAAEAAREWRWEKGIEDPALEIPRENISPTHDAAGQAETKPNP